MENVFDRQLSVWSTTTRTANNKIEVPLRQFLDAGKDYLPTINYLRQVYDSMLQTFDSDPAASARYEEIYKQGKRELPLAAIGGTFANGGLLADLQQPTNLLTLDIDATKPSRAAQVRAAGKEVPNEWVTDWEAIKRKLSQLPFVSYIARSVGNHGLFVIIEIEDCRRHAEAWAYLDYLFREHLKLTIDPATKDLTRPRFVSYDPQPYVNEAAEVFRVRKRPTTTTPQRNYAHHRPATDTEAAVQKCVEEIERRMLDITSDYGEWVDIAAALFNGLGDAGKEYYMRLSRFNSKFNQRETEYKWQKNKNRPNVNIGTFFKICSDNGIRYKDSDTFTPAPPTPTAPPPPSAAASATVKAVPQRIVYRPLLPDPCSIIDSLTAQEFDEFLSPKAVAEWQAQHPAAPF